MGETFLSKCQIISARAMRHQIMRNVCKF